MTNQTPRDSAQLPPHFLQSGVFSGEHHKWVIDYAERYAREALRAQAASAPNLADKSTQARLAAQWGYVQAASSPATAVDAVVALQALYDAVDSCVELTLEVMQQARAALQASRQPVTPSKFGSPELQALIVQQAVAEGAGDAHMWSFDPMIDAALATKGQRS